MSREAVKDTTGKDFSRKPSSTPRDWNVVDAMREARELTHGYPECLIPKPDEKDPSAIKAIKGGGRIFVKLAYSNIGGSIVYFVLQRLVKSGEQATGGIKPTTTKPPQKA